MKTQPIDRYAKDLDPKVYASIHQTSSRRVSQREGSLFGDYPHANRLRHWAGELKRHTISHIDQYLEQAVTAMESRGVEVHFASEAESARRQVLEILKSHKVDRICKSKSMATEEIDLRPFLEKHGIETWESDLGEFVVQLDDDHPSHIVTPDHSQKPVSDSQDLSGSRAGRLYGRSGEPDPTSPEISSREISFLYRNHDRGQLRIGGIRAHCGGDQ